MEKLFNFLIIEHFDGFATLLTGLLVYLVYKWQKNDEKVKIIRVVLMEVGRAEKEIKLLKKDNKTLTPPIGNIQPVLSSNNWRANSYLFANDLDSEEMLLIDNFYEECDSLQNFINNLNNFIPMSVDEKSKIFQRKLANLSIKNSDEVDSNKQGWLIDEFPKKYLEEKFRSLKIFYNEDFTFPPNFFIKNFKETLKRVSLISNTPAYEKMKKVAKMKK